MTEKTFQNSVRYSVSAKHPGGIMPGFRSEMWRDIYISTGAVVGGGVFGNNITVEGGELTVDGAIYARGSIKIVRSPDEKQLGSPTFRSTVCSDESILIDERCPDRIRFLADIFSDQVNIRNAFIRGNVYAKRAIVKDSVILGGVFCSGRLDLENVICTTFRASKVYLKPELMLFYPFALSEEPIKLDFIAKCLSFSNLASMACKDKAKELNVVFMEPEDICQVTEQENDSEKEFHMLSLGSRILDLEELKAAFQENVKFLEMMSLGDHLRTFQKINFEANHLQKVEETLVSLLRNPPEKENIPRDSVDRMNQRESVDRFIRQLVD